MVFKKYFFLLCILLSMSDSEGVILNLTLQVFNQVLYVFMLFLFCIFIFFFFEVYFKQFSFFLMSLIHVCSCVLCSFNGEVFKYREEKEKLALFSSFFASLFVTSNSYLTDHLQIMGCLQCSAFRRWCLFFFSFLIFL